MQRYHLRINNSLGFIYLLKCTPLKQYYFIVFVRWNSICVNSAAFNNYFQYIWIPVEFLNQLISGGTGQKSSKVEILQPEKKKYFNIKRYFNSYCSVNVKLLKKS